MVKKQTKLAKRRRREGKTNYTKRVVLLKGNAPRLVIRKSNKYIQLQVVESVHAQDKVKIGVSTKDLLKNGWPAEKAGSLKSLGACYLAGLLLGKKSSGKINGKIILDSGLIPNTKGSRIYAAAKGVKDSGIEINLGEETLPNDEKIKKHDFFETIKNKLGGQE
jgi:large subunit ribosomal protein L18